MSLPSRQQFLRSLRPTPISSIPEDSRTCGICQDEYNHEDRPVTLPCGHTFGESCLRTWFDGVDNSGCFNNTCPFKCVLHDRTDAGQIGNYSTYENETNTRIPPSRGFAADTLHRDAQTMANDYRHQYPPRGRPRGPPPDRYQQLARMQDELAELEDIRRRRIAGEDVPLPDYTMRPPSPLWYEYEPSTPGFQPGRIEERRPGGTGRTPYNSIDRGRYGGESPEPYGNGSSYGSPPRRSPPRPQTSGRRGGNPSGQRGSRNWTPLNQRFGGFGPNDSSNRSRHDDDDHYHQDDDADEERGGGHGYEGGPNRPGGDYGYEGGTYRLGSTPNDPFGHRSRGQPGHGRRRSQRPNDFGDYVQRPTEGWTDRSRAGGSRGRGRGRDRDEEYEEEITYDPRTNRTIRRRYRRYD